MFSPRTKTLLGFVGLGNREINALDKAPLFEIPDRCGFGMLGPTGAGKTWRLAQALGDRVEAIVQTAPIPADAKLPPNFACWLNWPAAAEKLKGMVAKGFHAEIADLTERWETTGLLFLDDIGPERVNGENDYALGALRSLLDQRYRAELPVFWTSNLTPKDLTRVYGARIISRVREAWPWIVVDRQDMRISGGGAA